MNVSAAMDTRHWRNNDKHEHNRVRKRHRGEARTEGPTKGYQEAGRESGLPPKHFVALLKRGYLLAN
jgi:hypothetical protein